MLSIARQLAPNLTFATAIGAAPAGNLKLARGEYDFSPVQLLGQAFRCELSKGRHSFC